MRPKQNREKTAVLEEYSAGWQSYSDQLEKCAALEDWLLIKGFEDILGYCQISGELKYQKFDSGDFNKRKILETLLREFPEVESITDII